MSFRERWNAFPTVTTKRLVLRQMRTNDAAELHRWLSVPEVTHFLPWGAERTVEETTLKLDEHIRMFDSAYFLPWGISLLDEDRLIGRVRYYQFLGPQWSIGELGYELAKEHWNKGIMTEAIQAAVYAGFEIMPGMNRVQATCDIANIGSDKALTKAGLKNEGVLRDWGWNNATATYRDHKMFSILRRELTPMGDTPVFTVKWEKS